MKKRSPVTKIYSSESKRYLVFSTRFAINLFSQVKIHSSYFQHSSLYLMMTLVDLNQTRSTLREKAGNFVLVVFVEILFAANGSCRGNGSSHWT